MNAKELKEYIVNHPRQQTADGITTVTGVTMDDLAAISYWVPEGFSVVDRWSDGQYRAVWVNPSTRTVITYCEGDMLIDTAKDDQAYQELVRKLDEFYENY